MPTKPPTSSFFGFEFDGRMKEEEVLGERARDEEAPDARLLERGFSLVLYRRHLRLNISLASISNPQLP